MPPEQLPRYDPMLLRRVHQIESQAGWVYQPKLDGHRVMAQVGHSTLRLLERRGGNVAERYPEVVTQLRTAAAGHRMVLDGELVGYDARGHHNLQTFSARTSRMIYQPFDMLWIDGEELINFPLVQRRQRLTTLRPQEHVQPVAWFDDPIGLLIAAEHHKLEGIVGKRLNSPYLPGRRSHSWRKLPFRAIDREWYEQAKAHYQTQ
jgi:bifunctional non-homologous end joining protein LigD